MAPKTLNVVFAADSSQLGKAFGQIESKSASIGTQLASVGGKLTRGLTLPIVGAGIASLKMASDVDKGLREVNTLFGETGAAAEATFKELQGGVRGLSNEMGIAQNVLTEGLYSAISAGVPKENVFDFMKTASKAAIAGVTDTNTAINGIASTLNAFGLDASQAESVADSMFTTVKGGITTFEELSNSMFQVAPAAAAAGVKFTDVNAALATLTSAKVPTSVATTQIRQAIVEMTKGGTLAQKTFEGIAGKTFPDFIAEGGNLQEALMLIKQSADENGKSVLDMFGSVEAGQAALALTGTQAEKFTQELENQAKAAGATDKAFNEMEKSGARKLEAAMTRLKNGLIDVGNILLPFAAAIVEKVGKMATAFSSLGSGTQKMIIVMAGVAAAIGPVLFVVGKLLLIGPKLAKAFQLVTYAWIKLSAAFAFTPIGAVILALVALGAGLVLLYKKSETFRNIVQGVFKAVGDTIGKFVEGVRLVFSQLSAMWNNPDITSSGWFGVIEGFVGWLRMTFDSLLAWWREIWPQFSEAVGHVWNVISTIIGVYLKIIGAVIQVATAGIRALWKLWGDDLLTILKGVWNAIYAVISGALQIISGIIKTVLAIINGDWGRALDGLKQIARGIWTAIEGVFRGAMTALRGIIGAGFDGILAFMRGIPGRILGALGSLGGLLVGVGRSIMDGLLRGIRAAWERVAGFLSGLANKIRNLKGPLSKDRKLLIPEGQAIMDGLRQGIGSQFGKLERLMAEATRKIAINPKDLAVPSIRGALQPTGLRGAALAGSGGVTNNYYYANFTVAPSGPVFGSEARRELGQMCVEVMEDYIRANGKGSVRFLRD